MKKLLLLALITPLCLFAKEVENKGSHHNLYHTSFQKRLDFRPFWKEMDMGDYRSAYHKLSKMRPKTFDDRRYVILCHLYLKAIVSQMTD